MQRQVFELYTKVLGREYPYMFASMNNLAVVLRRLGRYDEVKQMQ